MRRPFCLAVLALALASFFNSANPEDKATEVLPLPAVATETPAPEPAEPPEAAPVPEAAQGPETTQAPEAAQPEKPPETPQVKPAEDRVKILIDDSLPDGAVTQGVWEWDASVKYGGARSHTEPATEGMTEHSYRAAPVVIPEDFLLEQYVYLDPGDPPAGIMLRFTFDADGREGEIGLYREGEEEVFIFNQDEAVIYDGRLPGPGKWERWMVDPNDLGFKGARLTGISFAVYGGKAYWDLTRFVPPKKLNN